MDKDYYIVSEQMLDKIISYLSNGIDQIEKERSTKGPRKAEIEMDSTNSNHLQRLLTALDKCADNYVLCSAFGEVWSRTSCCYHGALV